MTLSARDPKVAAGFALAFILTGTAHAASDLAISQVYGGGGESGAALSHDFVEIFNRGEQAVDLAGKSVQFATPTGDFTSAIALPDLALPPGRYFLIQLAGGANGAPLPVTADATSSLDLPTSAGKVILTLGTAPLNCGGTSNSCASVILSQRFDLLGYDGPENTYEGEMNGPALSPTTAAMRAGAGCTDSDDNSSDFSAVTPSPRNSGTGENFCGVRALRGDGAASPTDLLAGDSTRLTVAVTGATQPTSTGVTVRVDLRAVGGIASQPLLDDGSQGDTTAGDGVYSLVFTAPAGVGPGLKSLPFTVSDAQARSASGDIRLSIVAPVGIHDIQGGGRQSPLLGMRVTTEGIVTAITQDGFFFQTAPGEEDSSAGTSEGLFVATSAPPAAVAIGNRVSVAGDVKEFLPAANPGQLSRTELTMPVVELVSTGNTLPAATTITTLQAAPGSDIAALEPLEGMRVFVPSLTVVGPDEGVISESEFLSSASGDFVGVLANVPRPFREPGLGVLDPTPVPAGKSPPRFDTNPERLRVASAAQRDAQVVAVDVGATVTGLGGVLDYRMATYTILPDPTAAIAVTGGALPAPAPVPEGGEITIGSLDLFRFYDDTDGVGNDVVLGAEAYQRRLEKTAEAICSQLHAPDILAIGEIEDQDTLADLAFEIDASSTGRCAGYTNYLALVHPGNDPEALNIGFLVKRERMPTDRPRVYVEGALQEGKDMLFENPDGSTRPLHDRPPVVLRAVVNHSTGGTFQVDVVASHLSPLDGTNSIEPGSHGWPTLGAERRARRAAQARHIAEVVDTLQTNDPEARVVVTGDFNAFEFNDGLVDAMGIVGGLEAPAASVIDAVDSPLQQPLTNMALDLPPEQRYSHVSGGNAQSLEHLLVNQALLANAPGLRMGHARINADFGADNFADDSVPVRISDHDPILLYLGAAGLTNDLSVAMSPPLETTYAGLTVGYGMSISNMGPNATSGGTLRIHVSTPGVLLGIGAPSPTTCSVVDQNASGTTHECRLPPMAIINLDYTLTIRTDPGAGGQNLIVTASVQPDDPDVDLSNNEVTLTERLVQPTTDLEVYQYEQSRVAEFDRGLVHFTVMNRGGVPGFDVVVRFSVTGAGAKAGPQVPAGWSCADDGTDRSATRIACRRSSPMPYGEPETLSLDLYAQQNTLVVARATISSDTVVDTDPINDSASFSLRILRRQTQ